MKLPKGCAVQSRVLKETIAARAPREDAVKLSLWMESQGFFNAQQFDIPMRPGRVRLWAERHITKGDWHAS